MSRTSSSINTGYAVTSKVGHLDRYKNFLLGWGHKFIKLDRSYLHHFDAKDAPNPGGSLVRGEIMRSCVNQSFKGAAGPFVFDVVCRNGTVWYFRAKSWDEMAEWMLAICPGSKAELERLRPGTSAPILNPSSLLPPPLTPQYNEYQHVTPEFGVFTTDPPTKNPNATPGTSDGAGSSGWSQRQQQQQQPNNNNTGTFPPSYSDLFDKHDPAVQGKK